MRPYITKRNHIERWSQTMEEIDTPIYIVDVNRFKYGITRCAPCDPRAFLLANDGYLRNQLPKVHDNTLESL